MLFNKLRAHMFCSDEFKNKLLFNIFVFIYDQSYLSIKNFEYKKTR